MREEQSALEPSKLLKQKPTAMNFQNDAIHAMITWHSAPLEIVVEAISKSSRDVRIVINIFLEWCSEEDWRMRLDWLKSRLLPSSDRFTSESEIADYCLQKLFESKVVKLLYDIYGKLEMNYIGMFKDHWSTANFFVHCFKNPNPNMHPLALSCRNFQRLIYYTKCFPTELFS